MPSPGGAGARRRDLAVNQRGLGQRLGLQAPFAALGSMWGGGFSFFFLNVL